MFCKKCQKNCIFQIKKSIFLASDICILLNNVRNKEEIMQKMDDKDIIFNLSDDGIHSLDLSGIIKSENTNKLYKLQGIVCSQIKESNDGKKKYVSLCENPIDSKWYKYEDNTISPINQEQLFVFISELFPEIFFYKQQQELDEIILI